MEKNNILPNKAKKAPFYFRVLHSSKNSTDRREPRGGNSFFSKRALLLTLSSSSMFFFAVLLFLSDDTSFSRTLFETNEPDILQCPAEPAGYLGSRQDIVSPAGSPVLFVINCDVKNPEFRSIWRKHLFPLMPALNFDAVFLVEKNLESSIDTAEVAEYGDIVFYDVPQYLDNLSGFYYRAIEGYRYGLSLETQYEWFIRPDMDAFYCLQHIRLELNALEAAKETRDETMPGIHWAHFYGDGDGGQPGPPVSDVHEVLNRFAAEEALKYAADAMVDGHWQLDTVEVYGTNVVDLSPNVTQVHDIRWAYGQGASGATYWNSGFIGFDFVNECVCANWLAVHLGKNQLGSKFERMRGFEELSRSKKIEFNRPNPEGSQIGSSAPYFSVGGCMRNKHHWDGCDKK